MLPTRRYSMAGPSRAMSAGFSLLEMVVAVAILALALGALYQAASGATRNVRSDERYAYAVELARSLLAANAKIPRGGVSASGETTSEFSWQVSTREIDLGRSALASASLHDIEVAVRWRDGGKSREVVLNSVVEGAGR